MKRKARDEEAELNITAFLNLMVVLIPFLLLNAVFAQVSVLNINLPSPDASAPEEDPEKPPLVLEVMIYSNRFEVVDQNTGPIKILYKENDEYKYTELHEFLLVLKERVPEVSSASILCEDDTPYEILIATMDEVRINTKFDDEGNASHYELFPDISIGSAPPDTTNGVTPAGAGGAS